MQKIKISPTYLAPIFIRRECYAAPCRINYTSHSRTRYRVTTAHNPPPPDSTRLCIRSKTTHMNNSTAQCRHDNFTHHTPHKTLQTTAHRLHQTPRPHTTREPNMTIRRTTHAPLKCSTHPRVTTHPNRPYSRQTHTRELHVPKASWPTTHVTPTTTSSTHTRTARPSPCLRRAAPPTLRPGPTRCTGPGSRWLAGPSSPRAGLWASAAPHTAAAAICIGCLALGRHACGDAETGSS